MLGHSVFSIRESLPRLMCDASAPVVAVTRISRSRSAFRDEFNFNSCQRCILGRMRSKHQVGTPVVMVSKKDRSKFLHWSNSPIVTKREWLNVRLTRNSYAQTGPQ